MDEIVQDVNEQMVSPEERLSDYAHVYDPQTHLLYAPGLAAKRELQQETGISDVPSVNQSLTGMTDTSEISKQRHDGLVVTGSGDIGTAAPQTMDEESFSEPELRHAAR